MKLYKMRHDDPIATAGPTEADVPEESIAAMRAAGWYLVESKPEPVKKPKNAPPAEKE